MPRFGPLVYHIYKDDHKKQSSKFSSSFCYKILVEYNILQIAEKKPPAYCKPIFIYLVHVMNFDAFREDKVIMKVDQHESVFESDIIYTAYSTIS